MPTRAALLLIALLALPLAGCSVSVGGSDNLDADEVAADIRTAYKEQTSLDLTELECAEIKSEVGAPLRCKARNERDVRLTIEGEVRELRDDRARYRWEVTQALAPGTIFAESAAEVLAPRARFRIASVECPQLIEIRAGSSFDCEVTPAGSGGAWIVTLKQTDDDGKFEVVEFKPRSSGSGGSASTS